MDWLGCDISNCRSKSNWKIFSASRILLWVSSLLSYVPLRASASLHNVFVALLLRSKSPTRCWLLCVREILVRSACYDMHLWWRIWVVLSKIAHSFERQWSKREHGEYNGSTCRQRRSGSELLRRIFAEKSIQTNRSFREEEYFIPRRMKIFFRGNNQTRI